MKRGKRSNSRPDLLMGSRFAKSKRSQGEIITTVLLILIVLAAVVIIWGVIHRTIASGSGKIDTIVETDLSVAKSNVLVDTSQGRIQLGVTRGTDTQDVASIQVIVAGTDATGADKTYSYTVKNVPEALGTNNYCVGLQDIEHPSTITVYPVSAKGNPGRAEKYSITKSEKGFAYCLGTLVGPSCNPDCSNNRDVNTCLAAGCTPSCITLPSKPSALNNTCGWDQYVSWDYVYDQDGNQVYDDNGNPVRNLHTSPGCDTTLCDWNGYWCGGTCETRTGTQCQKAVNQQLCGFSCSPAAGSSPCYSAKTASACSAISGCIYG